MRIRKCTGCPESKRPSNRDVTLWTKKDYRKIENHEKKTRENRLTDKREDFFSLKNEKPELFAVN